MSDALDSAADPIPTPTPASTIPDVEVAAESNFHVQENNEPSVESQPIITITITEADPSSSSSSSSPQPRAPKIYATTAEAIANFRPSSREVVRGIAPHVFDERKRRRSHPRSRSRSPKPYWYTAANGEKRPSPLRGATVISWDEHSIYLEQPETSTKRPSSAERKETVLAAPLDHPSHGDSDNSEQGLSQRTTISNRHIKIDKSGWKHFRVDIRLLKSIGVKLKLATSLSPSTKPRL